MPHAMEVVEARGQPTPRRSAPAHCKADDAYRASALPVHCCGRRLLRGGSWVRSSSTPWCTLLHQASLALGQCENAGLRPADATATLLYSCCALLDGLIHCAAVWVKRCQYATYGCRNCSSCSLGVMSTSMTPPLLISSPCMAASRCARASYVPARTCP